MNKLASAPFGKIIGGLVVVGLGVDILNSIDHTAAVIFVALVLVSIVVVNPGTVQAFSSALNGFNSYLKG